MKLLRGGNASVKGIGSKRGGNWNESFVTRNKPVPSPERQELRLLACTWEQLSH